MSASIPSTQSLPLPPHCWAELQQLRQHLHQHPDRSGEEARTAAYIQDFVQRYNPDQVLTNLGGHGVAAIYTGANPGPTVMIRADLDALPIHETNTVAYRSQTAQTAHLCGHDGHMTMVAGLAAALQNQPLRRGRVVLLFQPAEETGAGAAAVVASPEFANLKPDYVFALHNLPGYPLGQVVLRQREFAAASQGMIIQLQGHPAHAAHPEAGTSPAIALAQLITALTQLPTTVASRDFVLVTVIHARLGEVAFGTSPGEAVVMATLRSYRDDDMADLTAAVERLVSDSARTHGLGFDVSYTEVFPATVNDPAATARVQQAAIACGYDWCENPTPFRWSEDFGYFTQQSCGAMFGLGSGVHQPQLHQAHYDFPDALIPYGLNLFWQLITDLL